jgi:ADP-ribose pyrophosphatase
MRILNVEKITNEKWINLFAAAFEHNGHTGRWVFASRQDRPHQPHAADAVVIVPILRDPGQPPRLVMVKEFRVPAGGYTYGLPAGLIDPGESIETTVRRELAEETGLEVSAIKQITPPLFSSSGLSDETIVLVFVDAHTPAERSGKLGASEDLEVVLLDQAGIARLCDGSDVPLDVKAWMVLHHYRQPGMLSS